MASVTTTVVPGVNILLVTAVANKVIRVTGILAQGQAAGSPSFSLKSASGGTVLSGHIFVPGNAVFPVFLLPVVARGYWETLVGQGLYMDVNGFNLVMNVFYETYEP